MKKQCNTCGDEYDEGEFYWANKSKGLRMSICKYCDLARRHKYYEEHSEDEIERANEYRKEHLEQYQEYSRDHYKRNRDTIVEKQRKYRKDNAEWYNQYSKDYYHKNADKKREIARNAYQRKKAKQNDG